MSEPTPEQPQRTDGTPQEQPDPIDGSAEEQPDQPDAPPEDQQEAAPQPPEIPDEAYVHALEQLLKGERPAEVRKDLADAGYTHKQVDQIMRYALEYRKNNEAQAELDALASGGGGDGSTNMIVGGLFCVGGLAITVFSFMAASGGGTYVVAWGAVIFGALQFFRGLAQSNQRS